MCSAIAGNCRPIRVFVEQFQRRLAARFHGHFDAPMWDIGTDADYFDTALSGTRQWESLDALREHVRVLEGQAATQLEAIHNELMEQKPAVLSPSP